jgi:hypothetical protein
VAASACAPASGIPENVKVQTGAQGLVVSIVDSLQDAGRSPSVALDQNGDAAVAYLMLVPVLKKGDIPPAVIATQPQPPAVVLATATKGIWNRVSVTPQSANPLMGEAKEIANSDGQAIAGVDTGLAIDSGGVHHVTWSTPSGLFYSSDAGGSFGEPEKVVATPAYGASIAVASNGDPWISFYGSNVVRVAHRSGDSWLTEEVNAISVPSSSTGLHSAIRFGSNGDAVVAFGDGVSTRVATSSGGGWTTDTVPGGGGLGISLSLDKDGNPHVAYYDSGGEVYHAHSIAGAPWEVDQLVNVGAASAPPSGSSSPGPSPAGQVDPRWGTGIAVAEDGVHYVAYADTSKDQVVLLSNQGGSFQEQQLQGAEGGATPSLAVSADGSRLAVAWFDTTNADLAVAEPSGGSIVLAHSPAPAPSVSAPGASASPECEPEGGGTVEIAAMNIQFDKTCLAAPADQPFTLTFDNKEAVPHNVSIYEGPGPVKPLFQGEIFSGPSMKDYQVDAIPAGVYYFQCDVHGAAMSGQFASAGG